MTAVTPEGPEAPKQGDITVNLGTATSRAIARAIGSLAVKTQADLHEAIRQAGAAAYRIRMREKRAKVSDLEVILKGLALALETDDRKTLAAMTKPADSALRRADHFIVRDLIDKGELGAYFIARVKTYLEEAKRLGVDELPGTTFVQWIRLFSHVGPFKQEPAESIEERLKKAFRRGPPTAKSDPEDVAVNVLHALGLTRKAARNAVKAAADMRVHRNQTDG